MDLVQWKAGQWSTMTWEIDSSNNTLWNTLQVCTNTTICQVPIKVKVTDYKYNALVIDYTDKPDGGITVNFMYLRIYHLR